MTTMRAMLPALPASRYHSVKPPTVATDFDGASSALAATRRDTCHEPLGERVDVTRK
jgi:hypothetical protein